MHADEIISSEDFQRCQAFHGHLCPGLTLGFLAARDALRRIQATRAQDEEIVAIVENNSCFVDAVQVLTGCTFGKGNLIYKDYGKMALTLLCRRSGAGVRLALKPGAFAPDPDHFALLQKVISGQANQAEQERFRTLHQQRSRELLETNAESLFSATPVQGPIPEKAHIERSQPCGRCGEATMPSRLVEVDGNRVCRACAGP